MQQGVKPNLLEYASAVPAAVPGGCGDSAAGISRLLLLESCSSSVLSCPAWRAALGRCCREGLGSCLHSRFSLSLSCTCLFPDDIVGGGHSDKLHASLACLNLNRERAPSSSPSPPSFPVSPTPLGKAIRVHTAHDFSGSGKMLWLHSVGNRL